MTEGPKAKLTRKKMAIFLEELAKCGNVLEASAAAGSPRGSFYKLRKEDEEFAQAWDDALEMAADIMEREAFRRAVEGVDEPVFGSLGNNQGSGEIGAVRKYSDTLLIFLLKGARPQKYRERYEHSGDPSSPLIIQVEYVDPAPPSPTS
jgi:hypothetical protein